jgi:hypothetical protein
MAVRKVSAKGHRAETKKRPLRALQPAVAGDAGGAQLAPVPGAPQRLARGSGRGTRAQALDVIFASAVELGEGFRHGALGIPRYGKTYHVQEVVSEALTRGIVDVALVHDVKKADAQYEGMVRVDPADLHARPPGEADEAVVVFHPAADSERIVSLEEVSQLGFTFARAGTKTLVVADELYAGLKSRQTWDGPTTARIFREGSSQCLSIAWTTQIPQSMPTEVTDLSETVALFHLEGRSASYAAETFRLPPEAVALLSRLERGEFLLFSTYAGWDGVVYGPG